MYLFRTCFVLAFSAAAVAQTTDAVDPARPLIIVNSSGKTVAKPDVAVVFVSARSSAPLAADALSQNTKKVQEVTQKLVAMGYKETQVRWTGNRFSPAGQGMYYGPGQRPTGFDVYNNLYVTIEGSELKNLMDFNGKVSTLIDELAKLGATPSTMPMPGLSMGGASIVAFCVKDASQYERQAYLEALDRSRPMAEEIAKRMKVKLTDVASVNAIPMQRGVMMGGPPNPLDELPYEYISSSFDEVPIRVRVDVRYSYSGSVR